MDIALVGLFCTIATLLGGLIAWVIANWNNSKSEAAAEESRLTQLEAKVNNNAAVDKLALRVDGIETRLEKTESRLDKIDDKLSASNLTIVEIRGDIKLLLERSKNEKA